VLAVGVGAALCICTASFGMQALVLRAPSKAELRAADALRVLLRYRVIRSVEHLARGRAVDSTCLQSWLRRPRGPDRHGVKAFRGAVVLLSTGERLYSFGSVVHVTGTPLEAARLAAERFSLAGCPRSIGAQVDYRLDHGPLRMRSTRIDGHLAYAFALGRGRRRSSFYVDRRTFAPVALVRRSRTRRDMADLEPGGDTALVLHLQNVFDRVLAPPNGRVRDRA
jgi:hypothetical protein